MGQLLTEVVNGELVNEMTYDGYGNILTKNGKTYTYGDSVWKDKLTAIDNQPIVYDAQGNPTTYLGYALTWEKGRQLKTFGTNSYTYNANGIRTSKTVNGVTHTYTLDGANILKESWGDNTLIPLRDNEDQVCGILYNGTPYYFLKNLQGDIIAIQNANAETVARYTYDAWGVCTITEDTTDLNIANINPFRYRGYYYDTEIDMYYLQSRYYDPTVGRFVNGDFPELLGLSLVSSCFLGLGLFVYCGNNTVNDTDLVGSLSQKQLAAMFVPATIFTMFVAALEVNLSKGLLAVSAYVTKLMTPIAIKAFWWKPTVALALVVAAVAIVVASVLILYNTSKTKKKAKTKIPNKLKNGNKVKTPKSNPGEFKKNKGGSYTHDKTKWKFEKSKDGHYNGAEHWHASPQNAKTGDYYNVTPDGKILG